MGGTLFQGHSDSVQLEVAVKLVNIVKEKKLLFGNVIKNSRSNVTSMISEVVGKALNAITHSK